MRNTILIFLIFLPLNIFASDLKGNIIVRIDGFQSDKGDVLISLFKSEDGFPQDQEKAFKKIKSKIKTGKSEVIFTDISYGEYAIGVLHDENANRKMDRSTFGFPREGIGTSNNRKSCGPPKFEDAKFILNSNTLNVDITVRYY